MSAPLLNVSLTINPARGCHYLPKPGPGQAFLSEGVEGGKEGATKSQKKKKKGKEYFSQQSVVCQSWYHAKTKRDYFHTMDLSD